MMNETLHDVNLKVYTDAATASKYVAYRIATEILDKQIAGEKAVLGLATGSTPKKVYQHLINLHKNAGLSFENVYTFNLDEYRSEEHTSELQSRENLVCRLLL